MKWDVVKLNRSVNTENRITVPKGEIGKGGTNQEFGLADTKYYI